MWRERQNIYIKTSKKNSWCCAKGSCDVMLFLSKSRYSLYNNYYVFEKEEEKNGIIRWRLRQQKRDDVIRKTASFMAQRLTIAKYIFEERVKKQRHCSEACS
uniref:Uncharacterized protein n=1 Tax=Strongyloides venezuelensis TaxID=75913 RepID=A0A0K0G6A3_STRVS